MRQRVDARCDLEVARRAAQSWGVLTTDELLACGLTNAAISRRRGRGHLHQIHMGVWAVGHASLAIEGGLLAAVKACGPGAVLSHRSAATLWGFLDLPDRWPEVTVPGSSTRVRPGIVVHRSSELGPRDSTRFRGVPVTTPARTLLDLGAVLDELPHRQAVRRAQGVGRVNLRQLVEVVGRLGPRRGSGKLSRIIATGPAPTRSVLEDVVLDLVLRGGFMHPDVNKPLLLDSRRVVPDFRWPEQAVILEADGAAWHDERLARQQDAVRQALLEAHGERVLRVTWHQAVARPAETLARLRATGVPLASECRPASPMRQRVDAR